MHVQLGVETEVRTQLYRIATLTSLEFSSSQAPPFLVHWLEIQPFHPPVLSRSSCDCICSWFRDTWSTAFFFPQSACSHFTPVSPPGATWYIFSRDF